MLNFVGKEHVWLWEGELKDGVVFVVGPVNLVDDVGVDFEREDLSDDLSFF